LSETRKLLDRQFDAGIELAWKHVADLKARVARLEQVDGGVAEQGSTLREAVKEFQTALEELNVAQEELRSQNEEMAIISRRAEVERRCYEEPLSERSPRLPDHRPGRHHPGGQSGAARLLGIEQRFLIGKPFVSFIGEEDRRAFRAGLARIGATALDQEEWDVEPVPSISDATEAVFRQPLPGSL